MYGHVPDYLNAQALRLRAERAESLAKTWRVTGWVFGLALACLLCVLVVQERQLAESHAYSAHAERSERAAHRELWACEADLEWVRKAQFQHFTDLGKCQASLDQVQSGESSCAEGCTATVLCSQQAADIDDARIAAERDFKVCLSANAGLVEVLQEFDRTVKDQQLLIDDAVDLAKRCESSPVTWAATAPEGWQVVDHAR